MRKRENISHGKNKIVKMNAVAQAHLIKLLIQGAYSCKELAEMTGLHYVTVLQYCRELYHAGAVHICMWVKDDRGRDLTKIYKLGEGSDKKRQRIPDNVRQAKYREKLKQQKMQQVIAGNAEFVDYNNGEMGYREIK